MRSKRPQLIKEFIENLRYYVFQGKKSTETKDCCDYDYIEIMSKLKKKSTFPFFNCKVIDAVKHHELAWYDTFRTNKRNGGIESL